LPIYLLAFTALAGLGLAVLLAIAAALFGTSGKTVGHEKLLLAMMTFFWASTIGAIAVVGIYIVRTYKDVRGRPRYIVRQRIGL
jgi:dolichol-phosphate mannosyltransferase